MIGIYGVMNYWVSQRRSEIGIRAALGADPRTIVQLVFRQALRLILAGIAIGLAGAFALTRLMSGLLYGVSATDPGIFVLLTLLLSVTALLACLFPCPDVRL
jgi:putative ABC transport system permease protein